MHLKILKNLGLLIIETTKISIEIKHVDTKITKHCNSEDISPIESIYPAAVLPVSLIIKKLYHHSFYL